MNTIHLYEKHQEIETKDLRNLSFYNVMGPPRVLDSVFFIPCDLETFLQRIHKLIQILWEISLSISSNYLIEK